MLIRLVTGLLGLISVLMLAELLGVTREILGKGVNYVRCLLRKMRGDNHSSSP